VAAAAAVAGLLVGVATRDRTGSSADVTSPTDPSGPVSTRTRTSGAASTTNIDPPTSPGATGALVLRPDGDYEGLRADPVAALGRDVTDPFAGAGGEVTFPVARFDDWGGGTVLFVDERTGTVRVVDAVTGAAEESAIPPDDAAGSVHDAALGPDGVLYVSRRALRSTGADPGLERETFTLVAYELARGGAATELARWDTDWECVESSCGEVSFVDGGIVVDRAGGTAAPFQRALQHRLLPLTVDAVQEEYRDLPPGYEDDAGVGGFTRVLASVTHRGAGWRIDAAGVGLAEGQFTSYRPQPDGSVFALVTVAEQSSGLQDGRDLLVRLAPDGVASAFDVSGLHLLDVALVGGRTVGIAAGDEYEVVALER
jgi:hypothetical protein